MDSKSEIKEFILTQIHNGDGKSQIGDADLLIDMGIIDSMAIMKLLSFLEEKFKIQITGDELLEENFQSLNAITHLVESKCA